MTLVTQAVIFAAQAHDGAARKGSDPLHRPSDGGGCDCLHDDG